mmetsp:Transcript_41823/g.77448  ORF Transcript_41823/g.77448 Transcript_41823/m.77448 type:complete len:223 (+) Transcript_41823:258-926(+)
MSPPVPVETPALALPFNLGFGIRDGGSIPSISNEKDEVVGSAGGGGCASRLLTPTPVSAMSGSEGRGTGRRWLADLVSSLEFGRCSLVKNAVLSRALDVRSIIRSIASTLSPLPSQLSRRSLRRCPAVANKTLFVLEPPMPAPPAECLKCESSRSRFFFSFFKSTNFLNFLSPPRFASSASRLAMRSKRASACAWCADSSSASVSANACTLLFASSRAPSKP